MITSRFEAVLDLAPEERAFLAGLAEGARSIPPGAVIREQGSSCDGVFMLQAGVSLSAMELPNGKRQILKVHVEGDVLGATSLPFETTIDSLSALTACRVSHVPKARMGELFSRFPRLGAALFVLANEERALLMDALVTRVQLGAEASICSFFVRLHDRLSLGGGIDLPRPTTPLTQHQLGEVLGLSTVHVNRVLRSLEAAGRIRRIGHSYELLQLEALRHIAGLTTRLITRNPAWLPS